MRILPQLATLSPAILQLSLMLGLGMLPGLARAALVESFDDQLQLVNPKNRVDEVIRVIHDGNRYVGVNKFGAISTSTDGQNWVTTSSGVAIQVTDFAYGDGTYVMVGTKQNTAVIAASTNLKDWTLGQGVSGATMHSVAFFQGRFYAALHNVFQGGVLARSTDSSATTWEDFTASGSSGHARLLRSLNGRLFLTTTSLIGSDPQVFSSTNGADFAKSTIEGTSFSQVQDIIHGGGLYLINGAPGIATSTDGLNFTRSFPMNNTWGSFTLLGYGNGIYFGRTAGSNSDFYYSDDAVEWTKGQGNTLSGLVTTATNGTTIVGLGSDARVSTDGINWASVVSSDIDPGLISASSNLIQASYGNGLYVISASSASHSGGRAIPSGPYWISENGTDWTEGSENLGSIVFGNGVFIGIRQGSLVSSTDAESWSAVGPEGQRFFRLAYDGTTFLATSGGDRAYTSSNGSTWVHANEGNSSVGFGGPLVGGDGEWISIGTGGSFSRSLDGGVTWTNSTAGNTTLNAAAYGNGQWVVVGGGGLHSRSSLAGSWSSSGNGPTHSDGGGYDSVIFYDGLFYVRRDNFGTYLVSDGQSPWVEKAFAHSTRLHSVAQGPEFAIVLGNNNALFSSGDVEGGSGGGSSYGPLRDLVDVGNGVKWSSWLGFLYTFSEGWIYHYELGFLYLYGTDESGFWLWDHATSGFWYTGKSLYPYLYRNDDGVWYAFVETDSNGNRRFYHSGNQSVLTVGTNP